MVKRLTWSAVLAIVMTPLLAVGLLDPLEGFAALLVGIVLVVTVTLLSRVPLPKLMWIPFVSAFAIILLAILLSILGRPENVMAESMTPMAIGLVIAIWVQRAVLIVMVVGIVKYIIQLFRARKLAKAQPVNGQVHT